MCFGFYWIAAGRSALSSNAATWETNHERDSSRDYGSIRLVDTDLEGVCYALFVLEIRGKWNA